ncbi:MAG: ABC transporter substrate-binding protein [Paracoccaceae bacterium]
MKQLNKRSFLKLTAASMTALSLGNAAMAADTIKLGVPTAQSGPVGVADQQDWLNGVTLAVDEINAAGGVNGRMIEIMSTDIDVLTPEGTLAAFQNLSEGGAQAIISPFVLIPQPAMEAAAATGIPYLHGNTQQASLDLFLSDKQKYRNVFQIDVAETYYGSGFVRFLSDLKASGQWAPKNNKIHIVQEQIGYTQAISQATQKAIADSNGEWELGAVTDIQFPVQDWAPVMRALKETDAGAIMIDHWVAAELAAFAQTFAVDPVEGALSICNTGPASRNSSILPARRQTALSGAR